MTCHYVTLPTGGTAIVCTAGGAKRCPCGRLANRLCDWKLPSKRSGTCDAPLCGRCSTSPAPGRDLCAAHADAFRQWQAIWSAAGSGA